MNKLKLIKSYIGRRGYSKQLVSDLAICGTEKILLTGTINPKILKHLSKINYKGELQLVCNPDVFNCNVVKLKKHIPSVIIIDESLPFIVEKSNKYNLIISHFNYINMDVSNDISQYKKLLTNDGTIILVEILDKEAYTELKTELQNEKLIIYKNKEEALKNSCAVHHIRIKPD